MWYPHQSTCSRHYTDQDKDLALTPTPPFTTSPKGLALPWWRGQRGTCLPLLSPVLWGQLHTQLEVRCQSGILHRSPLASFQPLTSTHWNKLGWGREGSGQNLNTFYLTSQHHHRRVGNVVFVVEILCVCCDQAVLVQVSGAVDSVSTVMRQYVSLWWRRETLRTASLDGPDLKINSIKAKQSFLWV